MTTNTGVLDRIVDGETAVVLLESGGETVDQLDIPVVALPNAGRHEGAVFAVTLGDGDPEFTYRPEAERRRRETAQNRLDRLSEPLGNASDSRTDEDGADDE